MKKIWRTLTVLISVACLILSLSIAGCSRHPNEKQCHAYEEQLQAATSAEEQLQEKKQTQADAERKLDAEKQTLEEAKSETENRKQSLDVIYYFTKTQYYYTYTKMRNIK